MAEPGSGTRPGKTEGTGIDIVLWTEVTAGNEGVLITVGFGIDG